MAAVRKNGLAISWVKNQTRELCMVAIKEYPPLGLELGLKPGDNPVELSKSQCNIYIKHAKLHSYPYAEWDSRGQI